MERYCRISLFLVVYSLDSGPSLFVCFFKNRIKPSVSVPSLASVPDACHEVGLGHTFNYTGPVGA